MRAFKVFQMIMFSWENTQLVENVGNMMFQSIGRRIPAILLSALQNGVALIPMLFILPAITEKLAVFGNNGLVGLEMAQPAAYIITAAITLPITIVFLSKLPKDGEEPTKNKF